MESITKENKKKEINSKENKIKTIIESCFELTPLKLVDKIEHAYYSILDNSNKKDFRILSTYKNTHERKFDLIDFDIKVQNAKIIKKIKEINCIKIEDNNIYLGLKDGYVYLYLIETGLEKDSYGIENVKIPVSVINTKEDTDLLVGYENGCINIFDIESKSLIKSIANIHKTRIIALEYILIEKNNVQLLSTDEEGQVINISSYNGFLSKKTVGNLLYKDTIPIYSIIKFKPFEEKKFVIYGFISPSKITLYNLKLSQIFELKMPKYADRNDIPDIDIGWGIPPSDIKNGKIKNKEILLIVGWGRVITIYSVITKGDNAIIEEPIGFYTNDLPIIKLGFFSPSIIYFFDENKQIKVINTAFCDSGPYDRNKSINKEALIDEGKVIDKNIKYNIINVNQEKKYNSYKDYITCLNRFIYIFTNDGLKIGKILNYMEYIDNIVKLGNNWKPAMCLAIDIYKGDIVNFPGIPLNQEERKKALNSFLVDLLNKYIDYIYKSNSEYNEDNNDNNDNNDNIVELKEEKIIECINISIEFCLEINSIDFLLKDVERTFSKYGREDLFYKLLEPFIFNDLFHNEEIGIEALTSLYGAYKIKDEIILFSHLLTHINLKCLNNFMIKKISLQENLFDLIIYIFSNGTCSEDFFLPITKMFQCYCKLDLNKDIKEEFKEENEHKFISYYDLYVVKGISGINKMEKRKEYIGHKLMWYIDMCIRGNKFASGIEIDLLRFQVESKNYIKLIAYIYFWILHENIFLTLLKFDSYTLFILLNYFFTERNIVNIIKNFDFSSITADSLHDLIQQQENGEYLVKNINKQNEENKEGNEEEKEEEKKNVKEIDEDFDPFALKGKTTNYGVGVKLNDLNSVLEYIIELVESQSNNISLLDLNVFLIKYASRGEEKINEKIRKKILDACIYCLKFFLEYPMKRKDLISKNEDIFNIHFLSKKSLDTQNPYFQSISNMLSELIGSENMKFTDDELFKIKLASGKPFKLINIKIAELSKNYKDCIKLFLEDEIPKEREKVFNWIYEKFKYFKNELNETQENDINDKKKYYTNFINAIIDRITDLVKLNKDKMKRIIGEYFKSDEKLKVYENVKESQTKFEFLELLLYQRLEQIKEEEESILKENTGDNEKNIDLFKLYLDDMSITNNNLIHEKILREQFDKLLIDQIKLLIKLKRQNEVIKYLKKDIPYYPTFPLREALNKCKENNILEASIYIYQVLNENRESLNLTFEVLDKCFEEFKESPREKEREFLDKLNLSINICKENSESLLKKDTKDKNKKDSESEGEELWFDLLKKLYELEDSLENHKNKERIKETLQKGKAILLKEICSYVRIQKLISYVTEKQEKAQYKEYKTILETMLRSNNSFDRVLDSVMIILKNSIENAESIRKQVTSKGNNYNIKKCDVCNQFFKNTKDEIVYFFGCGHQSHENCCHKKKINSNRNRIIINNELDNEDSFVPECEVCRKNKIENENKREDEYEDFIMSEDREFAESIIMSRQSVKLKAFKFGNKKDKFRKIEKYDMKYQNDILIFK